MTKSSRSSLLVPIALMGATWAVRRGMDSAYRRGTGAEPPSRDNDTTLVRALTWAITTAAIVAAIEVLISRAMNPSVDDDVAAQEAAR